MTDQLYRIKPLVWEQTQCGSITTIQAQTFSTHYIVWTLLKGSIAWTYCQGSNKSGYYFADSIEAAKSAAEAHWRERIVAALEAVEPTTKGAK